MTKRIGKNSNKEENGKEVIEDGKMRDTEEELRFNILLAFDIFLIVLILYLSGKINNGSYIGNSWIYATVITLSIAVALRTIVAFFSGNNQFLLFKNISHKDVVKGIAYVCLLLSAFFQLCAVLILL